MNYIIKSMQTVDEIDGKGYVHYKSWQETYAGLAMGNAIDSVKEAADIVIGRNDEDGIAKYLERRNAQ